MPAQKLRKFSEQETYLHIYNKGVGSAVIFGDEADYAVFLGFLNDYLTDQTNLEAKKKDFTVKGKVFRGTPHLPKNYFRQVELVAYSLLPDHFHLLMREATPGATTRFMKSLCTRYSIYFNKKYKKSGPLFDRSYKSATIEGHKQLSHLIKYFHDSHGTENYSSRAEFSNEKETPWLSPVEMIDIGDQDGGNSWDLQLLKSVILEKRQHFLASNTETSNIDANVKNSIRIPEFAVIMIVFVVLLGTSIYRVTTLQMAKASSAVLSASIEPIETSTPYPVVTLPPQTPSEASDTVKLFNGLEVTQSATPSAFVVVTATESALPMTIYSGPSTESQKIREVKNGEQFFLKSSLPEWYEISVKPGVSGYIQSQFTTLK